MADPLKQFKSWIPFLNINLFQSLEPAIFCILKSSTKIILVSSEAKTVNCEEKRNLKNADTSEAKVLDTFKTKMEHSGTESTDQISVRNEDAFKGNILEQSTAIILEDSVSKNVSKCNVVKRYFLLSSCLDRLMERFSVGHWKDALLVERRCFTVLSFLKLVTLLQMNPCAYDNAKCLAILDRGLLFGAPLVGARKQLLQDAATIITNNSNCNFTQDIGPHQVYLDKNSKEKHSCDHQDGGEGSSKSYYKNMLPSANISKRRKVNLVNICNEKHTQNVDFTRTDVEIDVYKYISDNDESLQDDALQSDKDKHAHDKNIVDFVREKSFDCFGEEILNNCNSDVIESLKRDALQSDEYKHTVAFELRPSLERFKSSFFDRGVPVLLGSCMEHWPAMQRWKDMRYLQQRAGNRTVPIELGARYTDANWTQKLTTMGEFIHDYIELEGTPVGYLAQHTLFDQLPELRSDLSVPDYCSLGTDTNEPDINAWFGPAGTVSPLHFDPKHNILAQVVGSKRVLLFPPSDSCFLYPHDGLLSNTAGVDPTAPDLTAFPEFAKASPHLAHLDAGSMLYIPPGWWHHVTSLSRSFSVSFWWQ